MADLFQNITMHADTRQKGTIGLGASEREDNKKGNANKMRTMLAIGSRTSQKISTISCADTGT